MEPMITITIDGQQYEITDAYARSIAEELTTNTYLWRGRLNAYDNLNTITEIGRYNFTTQDNIANTPDGVTWGLLEVLRNSNTGGIIIQRITANNRMYVRQSTNLGATWSTWATFSSDAQRDQWTTYTETYQGLTVQLKVNQAMPTLIRVKIYGTPTANLATAEAYVTLATFSDVSMPAGTLGYVVLGFMNYGQLRISNGKVDIGYTRGFRDGTAEDIPSGRGIYVDHAFIVG